VAVGAVVGLEVRVAVGVAVEVVFVAVAVAATGVWVGAAVGTWVSVGMGAGVGRGAVSSSDASSTNIAAFESSTIENLTQAVFTGADGVDAEMYWKVEPGADRFEVTLTRGEKPSS
jgi:hypothetical protein